MRGHFLSQQDRAELNNFPAGVSETDLITYFLLTTDDQKQISLVRTDTNRLGFALLLCALRYLGFYPHDLATAPNSVVDYLAEQLNCEPQHLADYGARLQTRREHQQWLTEYLGFQVSTREDQQDLLDWLTARALENQRPTILLQQASEHLYKKRLIRPGITILERLVIKARRQADQYTYDVLADTLTATQQAQLNHLLQPDNELGQTPLAWLRQVATSYTAAAILEELAKLAMVRDYLGADPVIQSLPPARIQYLAQLARRSSNQALQRMTPQRRYPILLAFLWDARVRLTDEVLDLYDYRIAQAYREARRALQEYRLQQAEALQSKIGYLDQIVDVLLDEDVPDSEVRAQVFQFVSPDQLQAFLSAMHTHERRDVIYFVGRSYSYFRRFLPTFFAMLNFQALQPDDPLLEAIDLLRSLNQQSTKPQTLSNVPTHFIDVGWRAYIIQPNQTVQRRWYELWVMVELRDALRSGRIWVEHSQRYTSLESYLIPPARWAELRPIFIELVNLTENGRQRLQLREQQLRESLANFNTHIQDHQTVRIENGRLIITPFEKNTDETPLSLQIQALLPHLQLAELLHEVDTWTNFSQRFIHAGDSKPRTDDLKRHLYAVILAQARNIDFQQMVDIADISYSQLLWCNNWYIREETLQEAVNDIVNFQYHQPLSHFWGDGHFSSSDGQRFEVAVDTQNATPLPRYFGFGRGLTFLSWTSNQYSQYGTLVTPPTTRESTFTLDKILDNDTELQIQEHTTDTGGSIDLLFALFDLLGMSFAPRLRDLGDASLYSPDPIATYPNIQTILTRKLNPALALTHWDEMLRLVASLKFRWTTASLLISKLQAFPQQHVLTSALLEYGRLLRTLFILRCVDDENYRRRLTTQLNKGEKIHTLRGHLFSANRGRIRKKFPEEHLNQANCLNLLTNAIIVWNTVYMQSALDHLRQQDQIITDEEISHLSPVRFEHINIHGKYSFEITVSLATNGLRPLASSRHSRD